jgi:uncharacterized protein (DUF1684 family)
MLDHEDPSKFAAQWERWHRAHEVQRARAHGFLAVTGMHWLTLDPQRFDDAPGSWSSDDDGVRVELADGEELVVGHDRVRGDHHFKDVDELGIQASFGNAIVEVCRRDGHFMIRPRHPDHVVRTTYAGTPAFPASVDWVVRGTLTRRDPPRSITVAANVEGLTHVYESPGEVAFTLAGQSLRLVAFNGEEAGELFIVFTDATAGETTYAACRFLTVDAPGPEGYVTMDFNRATNPPCAYTDFATCPLPPTENHLKVPVEAGEKRPLRSH